MLTKRLILVGTNFCPLMTQYACAVAKKPITRRQVLESPFLEVRHMPLEDS